MPLPHVLLQLVGTAVALPFIVAAAHDLTVVPNPMMDVQHVTLKVRRASKCLHATFIGTADVLGCDASFSNARISVVGGLWA